MAELWSSYIWPLVVIVAAARGGRPDGQLNCVNGRQGHAAYPQLADNPVRGLISLVDALLHPRREGDRRRVARRREPARGFEQRAADQVDDVRARIVAICARVAGG